MTYFDGLEGLTGIGGGPNGSLYPKTTKKQYGLILDLLAAGEIEGLVGGLSGVYLNGTSVISNSSMKTLEGRSGICSVAGNGTTVTCAGLFAGINLNDGDRYLSIVDAGKTDTIPTALEEDQTEITVTAGFFEERHTKNLSGTDTVDEDEYLKFLVRIQDAGIDGRDYIGIVTAVTTADGSTATVYPPLNSDAVGFRTIAIDEIKRVSSITDDNTIELVSSVETPSVSGKPCRLSPATIYSNSSTPQVPYDNLFSVVRTGTRYQQPLNIPGGVPSASVIIGKTDTLYWYTNASGTNDGVAATIISGNQFNFGQHAYEEVDKLKVSVEIPAGMRHNGREGESRQCYIEFQVILNYKTGSNTSFEHALIYGKDYGSNAGTGRYFDTNVPAWAATEGQAGYKASTLINHAANAYASGRYSTGLISRKNVNTGFLVEFDIDLQRFKPLSDWNIEIRRMSPHALGEYCPSDNTFIATAKLKTIQAYIIDKLSYPTTAYSAVSFSSQDFQNIPSRAYHLRGKKIQVPSNYVTREEAGSITAGYTRDISTGIDTGTYQTWDGSLRGDETLLITDPNFKKVYCNNPAWVFYDILINKEYGLGDFISPSEIDIFALYQIGRYCDELVSNGKGGLEPRFACNVYLQKREEAYKVIKDLASSFRGLTYWMDGAITPIQDRPREPVYTFSQSNVKDGLFSYTYTGRRARVNQVNVSWNNPNELFKRTIVSVEDTGNILKQQKIITKDVVAFGATSEGQAERVAKWHMATSIEETEIVSFSTSINGIFLRPGDVINVQDKDAYNIETSGRIAQGSTTTTIILDRPVVFAESSTDTDNNIYVIYSEPGIFLAQDSVEIYYSDPPTNSMPISYKRGALLLEDAAGNPINTELDGLNLVDNAGNSVSTTYGKNTRVEVKAISSTNAANTEITVSGAFSSPPPADTIWAIGRKIDTITNDLKEYKIVSLAENKNNTFDISAITVYNEKFDEIEIDPPVYTTDYIPLSGRTDDVPAPVELQLSLVPDGRSSLDGIPGGQKAVISWGTPQEDFTDSQGLTTTIPYRFTSSFELRHNLTEGTGQDNFTSLEASANDNSISVVGVSAGIYTVKIRTVNDIGVKSPWSILTRSISTIPGGARVSKIPRGGSLTSHLTINSTDGVAFIYDDDYTFRPPSSSEDFIVSSGTTAQRTQSFSGLVDGAFAYLLFDTSEADSSPSDPWKAVQLYTDAIVEDINSKTINYPYVIPLGSVNNGLTALPGGGTVSTVAGSNQLNGVATSFTTDLFEGDLVKVTSALAANTELATAEYVEVATIVSDTLIYLEAPVLKTQTTVQAYMQEIKPDFSSDAIVARVDLNGTVYSLESYTQGVGSDGVAVKLEASDYSITYDSSGGNPSYNFNIDPNVIDITTYVRGINTPEFRFYKNQVLVSNPEWSTSASYIYTPPVSFSQGTDVIEVNVREKDLGDIIYTDNISILRVKDGSAVYSGVLSNEAHTIPSDSNGRVSDTDLLSAGGDYEVYFGADDAISGTTFSPLTQTKNGLTLLIDNSTGNYTLTQAAEPVSYTLNVDITAGGSSASMSESSSTIDELSSVSFDLVTSTLADGTYYFYIEHITTTNASFSSIPPTTSSRLAVTVASNNFSVDPSVTAANLFATTSASFRARLYSAASGGSLIATSGIVSINPTVYGLTTSSIAPVEGSTLTFSLTSDNTNSTTVYLEFTSPSAGLALADFNTPLVNGSATGAVIPLAQRVAVPITAGTGSFSVVVDDDGGSESAETFVPAIYTLSTGGTQLQANATVTIPSDISLPTAQITTTSYFAEAIYISCQSWLSFDRNGDLRHTGVGSVLPNPLASDDWIPVANRTSTVGDNYEIKWTQIQGTEMTADFPADTWTTISQTRVLKGPWVGESNLIQNTAGVQIRKIGSGSLDVDLTLSFESDGSTGSGCFLPEASLMLADLSVIPISDAEIGMEVRTRDGATNTILKVYQYTNSSKFFYNINNSKLITTVGHPILTTEGWKVIDSLKTAKLHPRLTTTDLEIGDLMVTVDAEGSLGTEEITSIEQTRVLDTTRYNLDVSGDDTYIINNVVVHNK